MMLPTTVQLLASENHSLNNKNKPRGKTSPLSRDWQSRGHQRADVMVLDFRQCGPIASRGGPTIGTGRRFFNGLSLSIRW
jgi:hypothetical protein